MTTKTKIYWGLSLFSIAALATYLYKRKSGAVEQLQPKPKAFNAKIYDAIQKDGKLSTVLAALSESATGTKLTPEKIAELQGKFDGLTSDEKAILLDSFYVAWADAIAANAYGGNLTASAPKEDLAYRTKMMDDIAAKYANKDGKGLMNSVKLKAPAIFAAFNNMKVNNLSRIQANLFNKKS